MNTITLNLPGIEARLDRIIELLEKDCQGCTESVRKAIDYSIEHAEELRAMRTQQTAEEPAPEPVEPEAPAPEAPAEPAEQPQAPTVSRSDVQQKAVALCAKSPDLKAAVRAVVLEYATNVSTIPEDKLAEVLDKLNALEV